MGNMRDFIKTRKSLGHITTARFNASYSAPGMENFEFSLMSINPPSIRANTGQLYFDGMPVEVFTTFQYDQDFSMTVLCDNAGSIYKKFIDILKSGKSDLDTAGMPDSGYSGNFNFDKIIDTETSITITALSDAGNGTGMVTILYGVRIKSVGAIDYSNSSTEVASFSVNASAIDFTVNPGFRGGMPITRSGSSASSSSSRSKDRNKDDKDTLDKIPTIRRTVQTADIPNQRPENLAGNATPLKSIGLEAIAKVEKSDLLDSISGPRANGNNGYVDDDNSHNEEEITIM